jgi:hypothetical protein
MQLHLRKSQAAKFFGGVKFELGAKVTLTDEEAKLVDKYKVQDEVLVEKQIKIPFTDRALLIKLTIGSLVSGQSFKCNDIGEIIHYEETIKSSCSELRQRLEVMRGFGGEEVFEFTSEGAKMIAARA